MTKKEVLRAVDRSIEHWLRDIVMPLELRKCYGDHYGDSCPLCNIFYDKNDSCIGCPLFIIDGRCGISKNSTWGKFDMEGTLCNAKAMVTKLVKVRLCTEKQPEGEWKC